VPDADLTDGASLIRPLILLTDVEPS
jgi:hypothetical protein